MGKFVWKMWSKVLVNSTWTFIIFLQASKIQNIWCSILYLFRLAEQEVMEMWVILQRLQKDNRFTVDGETGWCLINTQAKCISNCKQFNLKGLFDGLKVGGNCWCRCRFGTCAVWLQHACDFWLHKKHYRCEASEVWCKTLMWQFSWFSMVLPLIGSLKLVNFPINF